MVALPQAADANCRCNSFTGRQGRATSPTLPGSCPIKLFTSADYCRRSAGIELHPLQRFSISSANGEQNTMNKDLGTTDTSYMLRVHCVTSMYPGQEIVWQRFQQLFKVAGNRVWKVGGMQFTARTLWTNVLNWIHCHLLQGGAIFDPDVVSFHKNFI